MLDLPFIVPKLCPAAIRQALPLPGSLPDADNPVISATGDQPYTVAVPLKPEAVAVVPDLAKPVVAARDGGGSRWHTEFKGHTAKNRRLRAIAKPRSVPIAFAKEAREFSYAYFALNCALWA